MERSVYKAIWKNGASVEVLVYHQPLEGEHPSDRIHLVIQPADEAPRGWIMNVVDATEIIYGLSKAMSVCLENAWPVGPGFDDAGIVHPALEVSDAKRS